MNVKDIRKQIRNVLQEVGGGEAIKLAVEQCDKLITDKLAAVERSCLAKLDEMAVYQKETLEKMNKRAAAVQGYLVQQVKGDIQEMITKNEDSIDATIEILAESGVTIPDLTAKVAERIPAIRARKEAAAAEALKQRLEAEQAANVETPAQ